MHKRNFSVDQFASKRRDKCSSPQVRDGKQLPFATLNVNPNTFIKTSQEQRDWLALGKASEKVDPYQAYDEATRIRQNRQKRRNQLNQCPAKKKERRGSSWGVSQSQRCCNSYKETEQQKQRQKEKHIEKLLNLENEAEMIVFKIMQKGEDLGGHRRKSEDQSNLLKCRVTNIPTAKTKNRLTKQIMKNMKEKLRQAKKLQDINESLVTTERNHSTMKRQSTVMSQTLTMNDSSNADKDKIKIKKQFENKVLEFSNKLDKKPFLQVYNVQRRKKTQEAFLKATRKFNIKTMDEVKDVNQIRSRNSKKKKQIPSFVEDEKPEKEQEKEDDLWCIRHGNFLANHLIGKVIRQATKTCINEVDENRFSSIN